MKGFLWCVFSLGITLVLFGVAFLFILPDVSIWFFAAGIWNGLLFLIWLPFKKEGSKRKKIILGFSTFVFFILISVAVLEYFTGIFGFYSPVDRVVSALKRTALAKNFTIEYTMKEEYGNESYVETGKIRCIIDSEKEEVTLLADNGERASLVYENKEYYKNKNYARIRDVDTDDFFDFYNQLSGKDEWEDMDWDYYLEEMDMEKYLKAEKMGDFVEALYDELIDSTQWQKKALGLKKEGNTYTFTPDFSKVYNDVVDLAKKQGVMTSELKRELIEDENETKDFLRELDFSVSVTLNGRYVESIVIDTNGDGEDEKYHIEIYISKINKTTISDHEMEGFMEQVNTLERENRCSQCNEPRYSKNYCQQCEEQCYICDNYYFKSIMTHYRGRYYCFVCCTKSCMSCGKKLPPSAMYSYTNQRYQCYDCTYN